MVRARFCKYFTCFTPTEYRDTTTFDINGEVGIFWNWNKFIYNEKKSKRESFLTKNYSWQLSGAFLRNFFLVQFFSLGQLSVPCLLIIFFSGNFFSRLIFLLGQLSGACLFIKKIHRKFFMLRQFISPGQLSGACLLINDPRDKKRLFFPITVYSRNEKNITLKAITMKTFHWEDSDSDLIFPECLFSNLFFRNCVSEKLFQTKFDEILIWSGSCGIQKSDWQQDNFCK